MDTTYDVKLWKTSVYEGKKKTTHTVRWELADKEWRKPFATGPLAESFRSGLVTAARKGEAFSLSTGLPVSYQSGAAGVKWYDFAVQFVDHLWERTSTDNRRNVVKALPPSRWTCFVVSRPGSTGWMSVGPCASTRSTPVGATRPRRRSL
ncbi:hypothetical protein ACIA6E_17675 [Streptomyces sp. NPDC051815]|uniref:hypothetical protein n=1 Tax=Streptomyces sp. NPDC051815 TaxID=3365674 RepID=UPI00379DA769